MAISDDEDDEDEVCVPKYLRLLASKSREKIAILVKNLTDEVRNLTSEASEKDELISNLISKVLNKNSYFFTRFKSNKSKIFRITYLVLIFFVVTYCH